MEACLHFRGAALNASEAGISRATECLRFTLHCGSEGDHSSPVGTEGHRPAGVFWLLEERISIRDAEILSAGKIAESPKFSGEEGLSLQTAICLIERSELWMRRGLAFWWECSEAERRQNDNLLIPLCPLRASLLTAVLSEVLPGVLYVRGIQLEFEDLLAVLRFSPVRLE